MPITNDCLEHIIDIIRTEDELTGDPPPEVTRRMLDAGPVENARAAVRATKKSIEKRIREAFVNVF